MPLTAGEKLGSYEILSAIGAGGMGEVYRALDSKLGREVAIKVLPEEFTEHPQKLARFEREARLLASLNHPGIATLHGLEKAKGKPFLVMELVEGETLAERIARGPIPVTEALTLSQQIAEALEAAHEKGVIHRDLKPANIKVDPEGQVKVLDFGLAKAFADEVPESELSQSPTLSRDATRAGVILGTAAYMSPEQAKGKTVDKRTDIFSFGIVLYEMLTGKRAFAGEDVPEVLAGIINKEPDWKAVPPDLDPRIQNFLSRCFRKDRKKRLQAIGDVRVEIEDILADPTGGSHAAAAVAVAQPVWRRHLPVAAALVVGGLLVGVAAWSLWPTAQVPRVTRLTITQPAAQPLSLGNNNPVLALSPDGTRVVYSVTVEGQRTLVVRSLDALEATVLYQGLAFTPFFSPDGAWVGFQDNDDDTIKRVAVTGGPALTVSASGSNRMDGATWGQDDTIIFGTATSSGLWRVPVGGGTPEPLTTLDEAQDESNHEWPELLPGGEAVLFTIRRTGEDADAAQIAVRHLRTGEQRVLVSGGSYPMYVPTGHLVYGFAGTLRAVPFDLDELAVTGNPVGVLEGVLTKATSGAADFSISGDGSLVYIAGDPQTAQTRTLVWVDREGREESLVAEPRAYVYPRISPDGSQVALDVRDQERDIWIWDFTRETLRRLTFDSGGDGFPTWTPDNRHVAFASTREGSFNLFSKAADGTGTVERLTESENVQYPQAFSPDGKQLVFYEIHPQRQRDVIVLSMDGDGALESLLVTEFDERNAEISPDGGWLAYQSNASGQYEIYVQPFPNVDEGLFQISRGGGTRPVWARDGGELFYLNPRGQLMVVSVRHDSSANFGSPEIVLAQTYFAATTGRTYDVSANGERFLMIKEGVAGDETPSAELILVQNWFEELKRLVPTN